MFTPIYDADGYELHILNINHIVRVTSIRGGGGCEIELSNGDILIHDGYFKDLYRQIEGAADA